VSSARLESMSTNNTPHLQLSETDRTHLQEMVRQNTLAVKVYRRATALLALDEGVSLQAAAAQVQVNYNTVAAWRDAYRQGGLLMLHDKPRSGRPITIDGTQRAKITALACSTPPQGHARWSLRLLAEKAVELGYVEHLSHDHAGTILKKTNCSRI
jgi:putative transposase